MLFYYSQNTDLCIDMICFSFYCIPLNTCKQSYSFTHALFTCFAEGSGQLPGSEHDDAYSRSTSGLLPNDLCQMLCLPHPCSDPSCTPTCGSTAPTRPSQRPPIPTPSHNYTSALHTLTNNINIALTNCCGVSPTPKSTHKHPRCYPSGIIIPITYSVTPNSHRHPTTNPHCHPSSFSTSP